jgi:hypothetical protein
MKGEQFSSQSLPALLLVACFVSVEQLSAQQGLTEQVKTQRASMKAKYFTRPKISKELEIKRQNQTAYIWFSLFIFDSLVIKSYQ